MTSDPAISNEARAARSPAPGASRAFTVRAHWYTVTEAALLLGISETAVRRRISDRALTGMKLGRGWRVLLPGEPREGRPPSGTEVEPRSSGDVHAAAPEPLIALVRDLQRQNLALAGHIGYLQSRLSLQADGSSEPATVPPPAVEASPPDRVGRDEHEDTLREVEELRRQVEELERERAAQSAAPRKKRWWRRRG
jgi:excisionase family DNA binding protein